MMFTDGRYSLIWQQFVSTRSTCILPPFFLTLFCYLRWWALISQLFSSASSAMVAGTFLIERDHVRHRGDN
jgi:hypothetical protein